MHYYACPYCFPDAKNRLKCMPRTIHEESGCNIWRCVNSSCDSRFVGTDEFLEEVKKKIKDG